MTIEVIGAGFGRTGTLSMKAALEQLGFGPCHHMMEVIGHPEQVPGWKAAYTGQPVDWDALLAGYRSCVDWPACSFWAELTKAYPDAPVVLTVRDAEGWYRSCDRTIFEVMRRFEQSGEHTGQSRLVHDLIAQATFGGRLDDAEHCIAVYEAHCEKVRSTVPAERLLVYEVGSGWEPLCDFLGVEVPDEDFPRLNDGDLFARMSGT